ncbi:GAF and ANTAR domain-containing protein [Actinomycetospora sp. CA-101289]|uniref:GAF and ANTAR domain-containing protein n=1 Tax=Actinomycetospora sp. CA-101289 TaxID=3239893 RepID=UPI003D95DCE9
MDVSREQRVVEAAVVLADTLRDEFDLSEVLYDLTASCVELLDVDTAGLLLADEQGRLHTVASSHEGTRLLELFQLQTDEGPCVDCYRTAAPVSCDEVSRAGGRWPTFTPQALGEGVRSVHAVPMRVREQVIGGLNLFRVRPGPVSASDLAIAQSFATAATIGILQTRAKRSSDLLNEQLQNALNSRVIIEQAKGYLAERHQESLTAAFARLRNHARSHHERLTTVAREVVGGSLDLA